MHVGAIPIDEPSSSPIPKHPNRPATPGSRSGPRTEILGQHEAWMKIQLSQKTYGAAAAPYKQFISRS